MQIKVVIWQEENVWCGSVPALPGCHTWGENEEHLLAMLKEAIQGWLDVASIGIYAVRSSPHPTELKFLN